MGLLDTPGDIDPRTQGLLALGLGMLGSRGNFGQGIAQGGMAGLAAFNDAQQQRQRTALAQQQAQQHALQIQQAQMQMAEMHRAAKEAETQRGLADQFRQSIASPMAGIGGPPTVANAAEQPPVDPYQQQLYQAMKLGQIKPMDYLSATKKDTALIKLGAGEGLYQPGTYKPLVVNPKEDTTPSAVKEYNFAVDQGYKGSLLDFSLAQKRAGATKVNVDAGQRFENAYSTDQGKQFSDVMANINKAGFAAPSQIRKLERMQELLDGVDGGKLAPTGLDIASAANSIGIKMDPKLGNKEAAQALSREIAGGFRQPGTGPMTDKDFENFLAQVPDLSKSAVGRKQITTTMKAAAARDIAMAKMAREYVKKNGQLDNGFLEAASQYIAENPVVGMPKGWVVR